MLKNTQATKIDHIHVDLPIDRMYSRLGFRKTRTELPDEQQQKIREIVYDESMYCHICGMYLRIALEKNENNTVVLSNGMAWNSRDISRFLADSQEIFLVGATVGHEIVERRDAYLQQEKNYEAVIVDAVASEMVESGVQWIHDYLRKLIKRELKGIAKNRYSPGYGNFALEYQQDFFSLLNLEQLGLRLNERFLLLPEKSVTAVLKIL